MNPTVRLYLLAMALLCAFVAGIIVDQYIFVRRYRELVERYRMDCAAYDGYINSICEQP